MISTILPLTLLILERMRLGLLCGHLTLRNSECDLMIHDEFDWINKIKPKSHYQSHLLEGIGDDASVYKTDASYDEIICVDTLVEDVHFKKTTLSPFDIGHKALAVNISDVAAMGGWPVFYLVSVAIPSDWSEEEMEELYKGMSSLAEGYKMDLIGGDTVSTTDKLVISVTVTGRVEAGKRLLRKNALPGDIVFVTGSLGKSAAGLALLLKRSRNAHFTAREKRLTIAHQRPRPKVEEARVINSLNTRGALNDISDGIGSEAHEIAEASNVSIELDESSFPIAQELQSVDAAKRLEWMLFGGEDFELVGTVRENDWELLSEAMKKEGLSLYKIGTVKEGRGEVWLKKEKNGLVRLNKKGYNHFKS
ncbi:thiamine-phosphate kinase [Thalassobacillus sp. C254]|uniref:thiamine-phosphate kinase n=1 Tax=Thalassobacillus sp. C254 TaxID=1225341 RepID=UPI000A571829|nr:thiamine-phosphate kinase [Thalassobacillus sp. C254]